MNDTGMQPRGHSPRGLNYVKVLKARKIISHHCNVGDVLMIEPSERKIMPANDGLTEDHADYLIRHGVVRSHQLQPNDKPISVKPTPPKIYGEDQPKIESAALNPQRTAQQATTQRQRAAI